MLDFKSPILQRDYRYFEAARQAAGESDFKVHVGAIATYKGKVIASASSSEKTHPLQKHYNKYRQFNQVGICLPKVHAEIALIAKLKKLDIQPQYVNVYIYRTCKSKKFGLARPCEACMMALINIGIRKIYYTTDVGVCVEVIDKDT